MNNLNICIERGNADDRNVAIGFHIINGVFEETADTNGITYCIDQYLYEKLCEKIVDCGYGSLRAITNYGYSSFVIVCQPDRMLDNLHRMRQILLEDDLNVFPFEKIDFAKQFKINNHRCSLEERYYAIRSTNDRLAKPLHPCSNTSFNLDVLNRWKLLHYEVNRCNVVLTGNIPKVTFDYEGNIIIGSLPETSTKKISFLPQKPWKYSQLIVSSSYKFTLKNILCAEAACKWLEPQIAQRLNANGCRLNSIRIYPDYMQEWRVQAQCKSGRESMAVEALMDALKCYPKSENALDKVRARIKNGYLQLATNIVDWNLFAGYNLFSGCRYHLSNLLLEETYQQEINISLLCDILTEWQTPQNISIFATAVR